MKLLEQGWMKCNIDEVGRGNLRESSYASCIRNEYGDLISAKVQCMRLLQA